MFLRTLEVNVARRVSVRPGVRARHGRARRRLDHQHRFALRIGLARTPVSTTTSEADPPFLKPPAYGASKAALLNLTKYLATHWGPSGVRVNALSPGGVEGGQDPEFKRKFNNRVPLGRMCRLEDLEAPLLFLASDGAAYVTGVELRIDGGFTAW